MKTKQIYIIASLLIAALVLSTPAIYASEQCSHQKEAFKEKAGAKRQQLYKDLGLSAEQQKLLEVNKAQQKEKTKALFNDLTQKRGLMRQELQNRELNMAAINKANNQIKQLQAQMLDYRLEGILEVRKILTPQQFNKFIEKMDQWGNRFKQK